MTVSSLDYHGKNITYREPLGTILISGADDSYFQSPTITPFYHPLTADEIVKMSKKALNELLKSTKEYLEVANGVSRKVRTSLSNTIDLTSKLLNEK